MLVVIVFCYVSYDFIQYKIYLVLYCFCSLSLKWKKKKKDNTVTLIMNNLLGIGGKCVEIHGYGFEKGDSRRTEGTAFKYCWNRAQTWKHLWLSLASLIMQMLSLELGVEACSEASDCWSSKFTSVYAIKSISNSHPPSSFCLSPVTYSRWNLGIMLRVYKWEEHHLQFTLLCFPQHSVNLWINNYNKDSNLACITLGEKTNIFMH